MIPNGTGGLEDRMPVLWNAGVNTGRLTKEEFVAVTSANIARILNMYPKKGAVAVGSDADIVIWDPAATKKISAKNQVSRIEYNVFEGYRMQGRAAHGALARPRRLGAGRHPRQAGRRRFRGEAAQRAGAPGQRDLERCHRAEGREAG